MKRARQVAPGGRLDSARLGLAGVVCDHRQGAGLGRLASHSNAASTLAQSRWPARSPSPQTGASGAPPARPPLGPCISIALIEVRDLEFLPLMSLLRCQVFDRKCAAVASVVGAALLAPRPNLELLIGRPAPVGTATCIHLQAAGCRLQVVVVAGNTGRQSRLSAVATRQRQT